MRGVKTKLKNDLFPVKHINSYELRNETCFIKLHAITALNFKSKTIYIVATNLPKFSTTDNLKNI